MQARGVLGARGRRAELEGVLDNVLHAAQLRGLLRREAHPLHLLREDAMRDSTCERTWAEEKGVEMGRREEAGEQCVSSRSTQEKG